MADDEGVGASTNAGDEVEEVPVESTTVDVPDLIPGQPPTYKKPHEVRAAREMYGADYDRLVTSGAIVAPSREELTNDDLREKLMYDDAERTEKSEAKIERKAAPAKKSAKRAGKKGAKKSARKRGKK